MTSLNPDPLIVSLVQVATSLPMFLFALPSGALVDIVDKRQFLIVAEGATTAVAAIFAVVVWLGLITPGLLLLFVFLIDVEGGQGPVLVIVEYRIDARNREAFLAALDRLGQERRRDGGYAWGVFEDAAEEGRFLETFLVESWLEHLRQHERVTNADRVLQDVVHRFHTEGTPKVTHLLAAEPGETEAHREKQA